MVIIPHFMCFSQYFLPSIHVVYLNKCSLSFDKVTIIKDGEVVHNPINNEIVLDGYISKITNEQKEFVLSKQLLRSGTSIGANIKEAIRGQSKADFGAKMNIALKEASETEYWIEIAQKANIISGEIAKSVLHDCGSIRRMLIASINTAKENAK